MFKKDVTTLPSVELIESNPHVVTFKHQNRPQNDETKTNSVKNTLKNIF
jgi:3-phosphoglycerate kinase